MISSDPELSRDMVRRLIYRLLLVVPITLSILLITLFLFYQLPGVHVLDSSRIELGSERELIQTLQSQEDRNPFGQSRDLFYFSVYAGYLPDLHYRLPAMFRSSFKSLSGEVQNPQVMNRYIVWIEQELQSIISRDTNALSARQFVKLIQSQNLAEFESATMLSITRPAVWEQVLNAAPMTGLPLLELGWNGTNNVFHHYLSAMVSGEPVLHTISGEEVQHKFGRTIWWTLAYSIPALLAGWAIVYVFILGFYDRPRWLDLIDRWSLLLYAFPTFVLATLALVFLTSHRYGMISHLFPFPVFLENDVNSLWDIYRHYSAQLFLPTILFAIGPMLLFYRVFHEKIREIRQLHPSFQYLRHIGLSSWDFRLRYLSRYLLVVTWAVFSNLFVTTLGGSLIIEWIFNIPGMGRFMYQSIVNYDVTSTVFLVFIFTILQQLGHILTDFMIDFFYSPDSASKGLL